jgi:putative membrane protein
MTGLSQVLGVIFGIVLILVGILESFFFRDQRLHRLFLIRPEDTDAVRMWTFNLGFYNMIWGVGAIIGAVMLAGPEPAAGRTLLLFTCLGHVILGIILVLSERRLWASAIAEALLPAVIAVLLLV